MLRKTSVRSFDLRNERLCPLGGATREVSKSIRTQQIDPLLPLFVSNGTQEIFNLANVLSSAAEKFFALSRKLQNF
jgi:hypothetical protein